MISIIPIFLPQSQCRHDCIFCNQSIAVGEIQELTAADITETLNIALTTISEGSTVQAGFYGGSFTILPEEKQKEYLEAVSPFIKTGRIDGVRISTRPDAIEDANIKFLKSYGLQTVELGAQILDDEILAVLKRGHTSDDIIQAVTILKKNSIKAGLQLMTGLPGETEARRKQSFDKVLKIKPDVLRIHPTLVLKGSELEEMYKKGEYIPLTIDEAVSVCADLVILSESAGIPVIRIGLQSSCSLQ
jgi:histone acetyltransferase (RNA polymerase elongator complex component)